ncbi:MAG: phosphotransferase [Rhizobiales bacterium]|nr:phosphotransferase [Hyphomicrobiales bacterium]
MNRAQLIETFLAEAGWGDARRAPLAGDASTRCYERLAGPRGRAVLMDWPAGPDATTPGDALPYSRIAHLAEDCRPFVAVGEYLRSLGLSAPELYASALDDGLLLLEDLGDDIYGPAIQIGHGSHGESLDEMYRVAIEMIIRLQAEEVPLTLPVGDGTVHTVPHFDESVFRAELDVPLDWYMPVVRQVELSTEERAAYHEMWTGLRPLFDEGPRTLFLRDFHSPNMLWLPERKGAARIGLIDYQDALIGSRAYDVVSFLQDARQDVPLARERAMLDFYVSRANTDLTHFDEEAFRAAYAALGAERALRLIGLWPRLLKRDGKPHYMVHMPRSMEYLTRNLAHPALAPLRKWAEKNILPAGMTVPS